MKKLKQVICGLMACLMLADPVSMCSTAYAEENEPAEPEAILQMEPVEQEGTSLQQEAEQQEASGPEQEATGTADTSAPELDVSSLHIEYDAELGGRATLTYRVRSESKITVCWASIIVETSGGVRDDGLHMEHMVVDRTDIVARNAFTLAFYGTYQVQGIYIGDEQGNVARYYNSACSAYRGETPAVDMSAANIVLQSPIEDTSAPVIDLSSIRLEKSEILSGSENTLYVSVTDESETVNISAQFMRETGQGYDFAENQEFTKTEDGRYALPITEDVLGKWQLFRISASDACGNTTTYLNSAHPQYESWHGTENLCDLSSISFEVMMDSFATPVIDLTSLSIDKKISRNKGLVNIFAAVENSDSVRDVYICYRVTDAANQQRYGEINHFGYTAGLHNFRCWFWPSHFGKYEAEYIELLDYSGEWQYIYNSALSYDETLPENAVMYDLSALNFDSIDAQIYTMESLKAALAEAQDGESLQIAASENFVIDEDITIPKGVYLNIQSGSGSFRVAEGVTFTTGSRFNCYVPMTVDGTWLSQSANVRGVTVNGTWENQGNTYCQEEVYVADTGVLRHSKGYDFYCWGGLRIAESGLVENNGYLQIGEKYENRGALTNNTGATARLVLSVENAAELKTALACENPGEKEINFWVSDAVTLTEDVVISENTWLRVYDPEGNGKAALTVGEGVTLITRWPGYLCFECHVPLTVAGKLVNETGGIKLTKGLTITSTGSVDSTGGSIDLTGAFVNDGVLVKDSYIHQTLIARSMDELRSAVQGVAPRGKVEIRGNSDFTISEDITIPKGITVEVYEGIQKLRLDAGAKLTIDTGATLRSYAPVEVDGTVYNYGSIGARRGMTVNGTIHNYDYIRVEGGEFVGVENVVSYVTGACSVRKAYTVDSEKSLRTTLSSLDLSVWNTLTAAEGFTLTDDITIPQGVYLDIQSGTFKVPEKVVLTTYSNLDVKNMVIDGTWINYMSKAGYGYSTVSGNFELSGTVKNSGWIQLVQYSRDMVNGIENTGDGSVTYGRGNGITSLEELRKEIDSVAGSRINIYWDMDADTVLDADLVIPERVYLFIKEGHTLTVPENVTLHVAEGARLEFWGPVNVQGVLRSDGACFFDNVEISGQLENMGGFSFDNMLITSTGKVEDAGVMIGTVDNQGEMRIVKRTDGGKTFYVGLGSICDWKDIFRNIQTGDSVEFTYIRNDAYITVSEDVTLPERVSIGGGCFSIKEGATLTTNGALSAFTMDVKGKWVNNGPSEVSLLTIDGTVQNNASITVDRAYGTQNVTGKPIIIRSEADGITSPIRTTILDLQDVLDSAPKGATIICEDYHTYYGEKPVTIINENITIPTGITVELTGVSKAYLTSGHTFTVNGTLVAAQPVYIAGSLVINGEVSIPAANEIDVEYLQYLGVTMGGINIVDGGSCEINGSIRVGKTDYNGQPITDPLSVLEGVDISMLTQRTVDDCWYLTKKTAEGRADIFCELPTAGCSLRLISADGSVKELAPSGKGAAITNIAPGRYTLEVSKPGYVAHSVSVDTAAIADTLAVELVMVGDVNGCAAEKGDVDVTDMACLYTLLSTGRYDGQIKDEEYMKRVADVNGDNSVNILDYQALYMMVK